MARALVIEEESGTTRAVLHPHNGYYAGDFGTTGTRPTGPAFSPATVVRMPGRDVTSPRPW